MKENKKPHQLKKCDNCSKEFPQLFKTLTVDGVRKKVCQRCAVRLEATKKKQKVEKDKAKRKEKRERITEKKLDTIFSKLVRNIYPQICHSSKVRITPETSQCAHLIGRNNRCTRFDLRNCYPTTPQENMHNQLHVFELAKRLKYYYDIDIDTWIAQSKQNTCKLSETERREMYNIFKSGLEQVLEIRRKNSTNLENELESLRFLIIEQTKKMM